MLPRLILLLLQLALGWIAGLEIAKRVPPLGGLDIFVLAAIFAILVIMIGFIGSLVLKEVGAPSSATMTATLVVALIFAGLTLIPQVVSWVSGITRGNIPVKAWPLIGAVLGYLLRR